MKQQWNNILDFLFAGSHHMKVGKITDVYEEYALKYFDDLQHRNKKKIKDHEEILNILFHRQHSQKCYEASTIFHLQIKKIKFTIGYKDICIELVTEDKTQKDRPTKVLKLEYWCLGEKKCAVVYGNTRFTMMKSCDEAASMDLYFLLQHPRLILGELKFSVEPYDSAYPGVFPDISVYRMIHGLFQLNDRKMNVINFNIMLTRELLFCGKTTFTSDSLPLDMLLDFFQQGVLHKIRLQIWNDFETTKGNEEFEAQDRFKQIQLSETMLNGCNAWKKANILDVRDAQICQNWKLFYHFTILKVENMTGEILMEFIKVLKEKGEEGRDIKMQVANAIVLDQIAVKVLETFKELSVQKTEGSLKITFETNKKNQVSMDFGWQDIQIEIR
ncbi:hypothetical protein L5515_010209 [Caenorhabditis briggsae]|nr:hypothetical protein L5515_010209 [Caenorhabditis briggsae]